jgi:hypothetical protein
VQEHVIERFAALPGGGNRDLEILANAVLANVLVEPARPQPLFVLRVFVDACRRTKRSSVISHHSRGHQPPSTPGAPGTQEDRPISVSSVIGW